MKQRFNIILLYTCFIAFMFSSCFLKSDQVYDYQIKQQHLQHDLNVLRDSLKSLHPGLYWYTTEKDFDAYFDSLSATIKTDLNRLEFLKLLMPAIARIRCAHTTIRVAARADDEVGLINILPPNFYCINGKIYFTSSFYYPSYAGSEVLSINKIPAKKILDTLLNSLPADGYNQTLKYHLLNDGAFREGFALFFGQPKVFAVELFDPLRNRHAYLNLKPASVKDIQTPRERGGRAIYLRQTKDSGIAILNIRTFELPADAFKDSIAKLFKQVREKGIDQLIIDLRKNRGGNNANVSALFAYLAKDSFLHLNGAQMLLAKNIYTQHLDDRIISVNEEYAGTKYQQPQQLGHFNGEVVLLINGLTASAASEFAALVKYSNRATIVGEEAGGCYYGATGGRYFRLQLPNSGLEVNIPLVKITTAVDEDLENQPKGRGTLPHYTIIPGIRDIIRNRDVQMQKAVSLLKNNSQASKDNKTIKTK